jgi:hypothetical protein
VRNEVLTEPSVATRSQPRNWIWLVLAFFWAAVVIYLWSPQHYWPDADGYLLHVAEGRWVAHPPGYALFVISGRLFHALGFSPYFAVQLASLSLTVAGLFVVYRLMREALSPLYAQALTVAAAFSWLTLLNVQTGTSHASDLFTVSLLLLAAVTLPGSRINAWRPDLFFASALFLCAGFRLTTFLMMVPLCLLVAWNNKARASFWISCVLAALTIAVWQSWVIWQSGGYAAYSAYAEAMNAGNAPSSLVLSGLTQTTLLNIFRALLWATLGLLPFLVVILFRRRASRSTCAGKALLYGLASSLVPLAAVTSYLCTHPGYLISVVPGVALVAAVLASGDEEAFPWQSFTVAGAGVVMIFLLAAPLVPPSGKWQAVANGVLLQYSAGCAREAVFNTTARWLRLAGVADEIPAHRAIDLEVEDAWRERFEKIYPAGQR